MDPKQIALCGFSAGAHNVGIYNAYWNKRHMPKPAATILGYPLGDIRDNFYPGMSDIETLQNKNFCVAMLGTAEPMEEQMDAVSIVKQIDENTPPMFLWNTSQDRWCFPSILCISPRPCPGTMFPMSCTPLNAALTGCPPQTSSARLAKPS